MTGTDDVRELLRKARAKLHRINEPGTIEHAESLGVARVLGAALAALDGSGAEPGGRLHERAGDQPADVGAPFLPTGCRSPGRGDSTRPVWSDFPRPFGVVGRCEDERHPEVYQ